MNYKVKDLPESERPYEKCVKFGVSVLSDAELLAVILRTGSVGMNSMDLAVTILERCGSSKGIGELESLSIDELKQIRGVGPVKAVQLKCLTEFAKRLWRTREPGKRFFKRPSDCASYYMEEIRHLKVEVTYVLMLDVKCGYLGEYKLSMGTVNSSVVSPREIFVEAVKRGAVRIMLIHNHPSGDPTPSREDIEVTKRVILSGRIIGIPLIDSIIIGDGSYVSLRENGEPDFDAV